MRAAGVTQPIVLLEGVFSSEQLLEAGEAPTTKGQPRGRQSILNYD